MAHSATVETSTPLDTPPSLVNRAMNGLVNGVLAIKPLAALAKNRARTLMMDRAETIGVYWRDEVKRLQTRDTAERFAPAWADALAAVQNPDLVYPDYYVTSFHAYEEGNLGWLPAMEVEVAAKAVHARIWPEAGAAGDAKLRQSYHDVLKAQLPESPIAIADLGCGVGMSTTTLQATFPAARVTGVDLSPYFLAVAQYRRDQGATRENPKSKIQNPKSPITWHHAAAEDTGLPAASFDLVSACLMFHELPRTAAIAILHEARRLLRPGGHLAIMDMNPYSDTFAKMPPFVLTLLKSTEPYLDQYFSVDFAAVCREAGFGPITVVENSPRHRTIVAPVV
ncbi:MAG: class I SAM-dependent methyltransferase [Leptolyngbya sp.]|nr:class I SAM-dependent methyltransferase [Leptolyngbya sp.]